MEQKSSNQNTYKAYPKSYNRVGTILNLTIMKKLFFALACVAGLSLLSGCAKSKADHVIDGFEELVEEVEAKKGELTAEEWKAIEQDFNKRFEELGIDNIDESEFSTFEKIELAALVMRWGAAMAESAPTLIESSADEMKK